MSTKVFNTPFEVSMRILLLLNTFKVGLDEEKILYLDFFTIYEKNYKFGDSNINGDSNFMIDVFTAQRKLINTSIKELVLSGLIDVINTKEGFIYLINQSGSILCSKMESDYAQTYKRSSSIIKEKTKNMTIDDIKKYARTMKEINQNEQN